jgi:hypothetical protein
VGGLGAGRRCAVHCVGAVSAPAAYAYACTGRVGRWSRLLRRLEALSRLRRAVW